MTVGKQMAKNNLNVHGRICPSGWVDGHWHGSLHKQVNPNSLAYELHELPRQEQFKGLEFKIRLDGRIYKENPLVVDPTQF